MSELYVFSNVNQHDVYVESRKNACITCFVMIYQILRLGFGITNIYTMNTSYLANHAWGIS